MAVISTDPVTSDPSPAESVSNGRWGRGDFASPVYTDVQPNQPAGSGFIIGRWGRGDFADPVSSELQPNQEIAPQSYSRWGRGSFMSPANSYLPQPAAVREYTYRSRVGGEYVYTVGEVPAGATDVIIVSGVKG